MTCTLFGHQRCLHDKKYANVSILVVREINNKNDVTISNKESLLNLYGVDRYS